MAEGHAVHGMARRVRRLGGQVGRSTGPVTEACDPRLLDGLGVRDAEAHGKHLLVHLEGSDLSPHLHLGMHGGVSVRVHRRALAPDGLPRTDPPVKDGLAWRHLTAGHVLEVTRPTICELLDEDGREALHARLGPDPLRDDADPDLAVARLHRSRRAIGQLLLDQSVVSGIGNVYRAELLWRARISPHTPAQELAEEQLRALWDDTVDLMSIGLGAGWILTHPDQLTAARACWCAARWCHAGPRGMPSTPAAASPATSAARRCRPSGWGCRRCSGAPGASPSSDLT